MPIKEFIKWYCNLYYWIKPYFISFVEEGIRNENYKDYIGGRVEIFTQWSRFDINEYRFLTKDTEAFYKIRDKYEFKNLSWWGLKKLKKIISKFNEQII